MSDIERAAFEEWTVKARGALDLSRKLDGTYRVASRNVELMVWQARASRPVVVTDERIEAVARKLAGQDMREDGFSEQAALDAEKGDMWRNFKSCARVAIAALNGGTD